MHSEADYKVVVVKAMEKYGGSFVQALAVCFYRADPINFCKLRLAFSNYWDEYTKLITDKENGNS